ncbi:MAG: DinB family protein [Acidobacteria bacterium]|nr:DinB family protein [Acidobacteriota bacterium]
MSKELREQLVQVIDWDHAHIRFDDAVKDFPAELRGKRPEGGPHSPWELLEHLRITLWDIVEFTRDEKHVSPEWPSGYWPKSAEPPTDKAWDEAIAQYKKDLKTLAEITADESIDLYSKIPHGSGQTVLREILLSIDHNAYHVGQLMLVRKTLGA